MKNLPLSIILAWCLATLASFSQTSQAIDAVVESAREIPVAYDVDVAIVGGSTGAITAAVEAASKGASVFLAAPRPYLGEDVAGTLRLWLEDDEQAESPLEKALFEREDPVTGFPNRLSFTYEVDQPANRKHADPKSTVLTDGAWQLAASHSVQFDADTTVIADLGKMARLKELHLMSFLRQGEFEVGGVEVWTSPNGKLWRELGEVEQSTVTGTGDAVVQWTMPVKQPCRFVKVLAKKAPEAQRILLGELLLIEDAEVTVDPEAVRPPATPMQVKVALDEALLGAGVQYLYGSIATDLLVDEKGQPAGIVMANRAGRQAVKAKVVIDATARGSLARAAGVEFAAYPAGKQTFQRIVAGGDPKTGDGIEVETARVKFYSAEGAHDVYVYDLEIPMADDSAASFARAEVIARGETFDVALVDESDVLFQVPPDPMKGKISDSAANFDAQTVDLAAFQSANLDRFFVLGGCADLSRDAAAGLLRPLNLMRVGTRIGAAAAELASQATVSGEVSVKAASPEGARKVGEVAEFLNGPRPTDEGLPTVSSAARALPVLGEYDVVVAGGGTGGAPAGIGAGRKGAKTLVIEFQDHLGGVGTLGLISSYYHGYRKGFTEEIDQHVDEMGGPKRKGGWNPVAKREVWRNQIVEAGGDIWFSTLACGAIVENGAVKGVVVATSQGRGVVLAKAVVDSTGNSDIAVAAGAKFMTTSAEHVAMQGTGLSPRALGTGYHNTDYSFADESDPVDQWRMIVAGRKKYRGSYDLSSFIDTRERRRIVGDAYISPLDIINGRTWHDTIAIHESNFDTHGYTVHPVFLIDFPDKKDMQAPVPYRALLPEGIEGVLVTGLGISAHRDAMPILRMQPCVQNQGYAAGVAAATVAEQGIPLRSLDVKALQKHLVEIGSLPEEVLEAQDSGPAGDDVIAAAVASVVNDYRGLAILLEEKDRSLPLLKKAYQSTEDAEPRLIYANLLGMLGDPTGAPTLIETIRSHDWDEGWNFRGMGQFGGSISPLDSQIIALGRSGDSKGIEAILEKVDQLDATREFSHHRAVAMALEAERDPAAAESLAGLLMKEGMMGHAITEIGESDRQEERSEPLREIILARALYRCGDHQGLGEKILRQYEHDLRGLFAKHAHAVLEEGNQR
ncbi:MAG: FAD-dependent oxidoreductase [Verrucomicrobiae bacterium]|nr:FAD-dependent oxidoreductase [Verrucomicrobiae bacterium]